MICIHTFSQWINFSINYQWIIDRSPASQSPKKKNLSCLLFSSFFCLFYLSSALNSCKKKTNSTLAQAITGNFSKIVIKVLVSWLGPPTAQSTQKHKFSVDRSYASKVMIVWSRRHRLRNTQSQATEPKQNHSWLYIWCCRKRELSMIWYSRSA